MFQSVHRLYRLGRWVKTPSCWCYGLMLVCMAVVLIVHQHNVPFPYRVVEVVRYTGISVHMWLTHDWVVLRDSAGVYLNKPPLQFWLTNILWVVLGFKAFILRLVPGLAAVGIGVVSVLSFRCLFPEFRHRAVLVALCLAVIPYLLEYITIYNQDMLLMFAITLALYGFMLASGAVYGWLIACVGLALGWLAKGPVILVFVMPAAILLPYFLGISMVRRCWHGCVLVCVVVSCVPLLIWFASVAHHVTLPVFVSAFRHSTAENSRLSSGVFSKHYFTMIHMYFLYPIMLLPLVIWPYLIRAVRHQCRSPLMDVRIRWLLWSIFVAWLILLLMPHRATRYLIPLDVMFALVAAYALLAYGQSQQQVMSNLPYIILCFLLFCFILLFIKDIRHWDMRVNNAVINARLVITVSVLGLLFILMTGWRRKLRVEWALLQQLCLTTCLVVIYMALFETPYQYVLEHYYRCVDHQAKQHELAFLYQGGGSSRFFGISSVTTMHAPIFYDAASARQWLQQNPNGRLVYSTGELSSSIDAADCSAVLAKSVLLLGTMSS